MDELQESELGSQEYWDNRYKEEIANYADHGDPGEIWFGEDTVGRIITWMKEQGVSKNAKVLDVGCGNGMFLIELSSEGYRNLFGIDYSEDAVVLAKSIAQKKAIEIDFCVGDILESLEGQFDVIHDKGTYDAISLNANITEQRKHYLENINKSLDPNGFFIITSCNWTEEDLNGQFRNYFEYCESIPAPQFTFGGQTGNIVSTVIYKKKQ